MISDKLYKTVAEGLVSLMRAFISDDELERRIEEFSASGLNTADFGISFAVMIDHTDRSTWTKVGERLKKELEKMGFNVDGTFKRKNKRKSVRNQLIIDVKIFNSQEGRKVCIIYRLTSETRDDIIDISTIRACKPL